MTKSSYGMCLWAAMSLVHVHDEIDVDLKMNI